MDHYFKAAKYKLIYIFRINDEAHRDSVKVGEATIGEDLTPEEVLKLEPNAEILKKYAHERIDDYTRTAGIAYELLHAETAVYSKDDGKTLKDFSDHAVHEVLRRSGVKQATFTGSTARGKEWFLCDLDTAKSAIAAVKEERTTLTPNEVSTGHSPIILRDEQRAAIDKTKKRFKKGNQMLWNAKMRFGKTPTALQLVREMDVHRTLILTHRPVVNEGWFEDFGKIFYEEDTPFIYGSRDNGAALADLLAQQKNGKHIIYFASMQDLRGSAQVGGDYDKNNEVFALPWDLIIVDEAHEGTQTTLGKAVLAALTKKTTKVLSLSGTPFNLLDAHKEEEIYTWDYTMEQKAKHEWDKTHFGDHNPYAVLPQMTIYTYDLGNLLGNYDDGEIAFNFREFFRVADDGTFLHDADIARFLDLLTTSDADSCYPFTNATFRDIFLHTLWVVPSVAAAKGLSQKLQQHTVFQHFKVINVAGEGDDDERGDALDLVRNGIKGNERTITLTVSSGRLTTGVTVPEWTGVLMLAGSYSSAAAAYMQTIFRVQSPATINGRMKEDCYVFDFAPDRTLQVLATVPRVATKAGQTTDRQREALREFLNFCPVIAIGGSRMTVNRMTADKMIEHLKRAYVERVVRSGFEDGYLYNDRLLQLDDKDLRAFDNLKKIIGTTKAMGNVGDIVLNDQGLTAEQYAKKEQLEKKARTRQGLTEEEKKELEKIKQAKEERAKAISILRGISVRMPLLIYGAEINDEEEEVTLDNFAELVDDASWQEFMPTGVTKKLFAKFKQYYDREVFAAAGRRIRSLVREADTMSIEERIERIAYIFSTLRNPDKETVLTPWRVVNMHMGDTLGGYCFYDEGYQEPLTEPRYIDRGAITNEVFAASSHLLEINSKTGLYPLYLAYNVYRRRLKESMFSPKTPAAHYAFWDKAVAENIFVLCKTPMARSITRRTLMGFRQGTVHAESIDDLVQTIKSDPTEIITKVQQGKTFWHANDNDNMKFNAVVGNPPYQEEGISTRKQPIYHLFMDVAFALSDKATLITPGRFLFHAGQTSAEWMDRILADTHFKVVDYFKKSDEVFPAVDIKGGVAITMYDAQQDFGAIGFFSDYEELRSILQKVQSHPDFKQGAFADIVSSRALYKFSDLLFEKYPYVKDVQGNGTGSQIASNSLQNLPEIFLPTEPNDSDKYIQIYGRESSNRVLRWIRRDYVQTVDTLDFYKVFVPEANGTGAIGEVLSTPVIGLPVVGLPVVGHTDTFLTIGKFDTAAEAEACLKYVKTKFARTLLGTLKATQHNSRDTWANVPLQDFTASSDIDWSATVAEIDQQLYKKYGLTADEQQFIETMIKAM